MTRRTLLGLISCSLFLAMCWLLVSADAQENQRVEKAAHPLGTPVLWREPSDIVSRNLYLGPGGEAMKPNLSKVTLVEEKESASAAKFRVHDGSGREWMIKVGGETQSEVAASRIVWAVGYYTDVTYLAPRVEIAGKGIFETSASKLAPRASSALKNGCGTTIRSSGRMSSKVLKCCSRYWTTGI